MNILESLKKAIQGEIEGRELYLAAAEKSSDPQAKEVFNFLSMEEDEHIKALVKIGENLAEGNKIEPADLKKYTNLDSPGSSIFSDNFRSRLEGKHFEMSAISIGLKLELDSFRFYADLAKQTEDAELKKLFQTLSDWEKGHYDALQREMDSLHDSYFEQNHFAPF